ncbi:gas vesicle protein GvpO [Streptomyces polygonati]|uniref:Gas vesicle protein GvpO n=1 Tax=Streptomyces polygonati TaxID=1617087 RepID=A0ABV8HT51_9ACTN
MAEQRVRGSRPATRRSSSRPSGVTDAAEAARQATRGLSRLIGHPAEGSSEVSPLEENRWRVCVDVLEVERIPDTTSLMATYEVELDEDGSLLSYRRLRRYRRGAADR